MKKVLLLALSIFLITGCGTKEFKEQTDGDKLKFKIDYEILNEELDKDGNPAYKQLTIDKENNIVYLTYGELIKFIEEGSGVLYIGRPACPWCRRLVPSMLEFAKENNLNIYYYDIEKDRADNSDPYKNILSLLDKYLPNDDFTQKEDDENYDPNLKRVVLPHVFFFKSGEVKTEKMFYKHEFLANDEDQKVIDLLNEMYEKIK